MCFAKRDFPGVLDPNSRRYPQVNPIGMAVLDSAPPLKMEIETYREDGGSVFDVHNSHMGVRTEISVREVRR